MSILFINNAFETFTPTQSGAVATHIWECTRAAKKSGIEPFVISRRCEAEPYPMENLILLDYPSLPEGRLTNKVLRAQRKLTGWRYLREGAYAGRLAEAIRKAKLQDAPMVLHNDPELAVFLRSQFPKAVIVHHFHNPLECKGRFQRLFAKSCNAITGVSNFISRRIEQVYGLGEGTVATIYNGIDSDRFSPSTEVDGERAVINFVGRTGIEKAPDLVLSAAKELAKERTDFAVQILGSNHWSRFEMDEYQAKLQAYAGELERANIPVRFPGHIVREALPGELRKAHIHVVPSRWDEPCALSIFEGMAAGLPIVASRTGGTPEIVGDAGFLFERDSVEGLVAQLRKLLSSRELRAEFGRKARSRIEQFTWERTWNGYRAAAGI